MIFVGLWILEERSCKSFHLASTARRMEMDIDEKEMIAIIVENVSRENS